MTSSRHSAWAKRTTPDGQWSTCTNCGFIIRDAWATTERCPVYDSAGDVETVEAYAVDGDDIIQVPT